MPCGTRRLIGTHQREHGGDQTARRDVLDLAHAGYPVTRRRGHAFISEVAPRLARRARARQVRRLEREPHAVELELGQAHEIEGHRPQYHPGK